MSKLAAGIIVNSADPDQSDLEAVWPGGISFRGYTVSCHCGVYQLFFLLIFISVHFPFGWMKNINNCLPLNINLVIKTYHSFHFKEKKYGTAKFHKNLIEKPKIITISALNLFYNNV